MSSTTVLAKDLGPAIDEELAAAARNKDAGGYENTQAAELGPADDLLQRQASEAAADHALKLCARGGRGDKQVRLVLGEDAARRSQNSNDLGPARAGAANQDRGGLKLAQLRAGDGDPHPVLLAKIHQDCDVFLDAQHGTQTVLIVRYQVLNGKDLRWRQRSRLVEGTSGQQAPWRRAGIHHYQYAPSLAGA